MAPARASLIQWDGLPLSHSSCMPISTEVLEFGLPRGLQDYSFVDKAESSEVINSTHSSPCTLFSVAWCLPGWCLGSAWEGLLHSLGLLVCGQHPCIPVGADVMHEQSLNAEILLKNHLVDFIIVCHLDALLIRVQQVLLTTRIGNKGML